MGYVALEAPGFILGSVSCVAEPRASARSGTVRGRVETHRWARHDALPALKGGVSRFGPLLWIVWIVVAGAEPRP